MKLLTRAPLLIVLLVAAGLAGCTDDGPKVTDGAVEGSIDETEFQLEVGKGAIEGLLVDDRFRPIDLEDEPQTEFQTTGFVLLQETGQQVQTDENGQFAFVDLEPGSYTLRVTAGGHEATPTRVTVEEGVFAEAQILARRTNSAGSTILTQEYSVFIPCSFRTIENGRTFNCILDLSGESFRTGFTVNYTTLGDAATWLITEMEANQQGGYRVQVRGPDFYRYGTENNYDTSYIKIENQFGVSNEVDNFYGDNMPWENDREFDTILFPLGQFEQEVIENWPSNPAFEPCCGLGVRTGVQAKFIQSVFIGQPEVDPLTYCVLC